MRGHSIAWPDVLYQLGASIHEAHGASAVKASTVGVVEHGHVDLGAGCLRWARSGQGTENSVHLVTDLGVESTATVMLHTRVFEVVAVLQQMRTYEGGEGQVVDTLSCRLTSQTGQEVHAPLLEPVLPTDRFLHLSGQICEQIGDVLIAVS